MHRPTLTAFLVAPLVGFTAASVVDVCSGEEAPAPAAVAVALVGLFGAPDGGGAAGGAGAVAAWDPAAPAPGATEAYRAGRTWGLELAGGAAPVDAATACPEAAALWATAGRSSAPVPVEERRSYQQGCSDAVTAG